MGANASEKSEIVSCAPQYLGQTFLKDSSKPEDALKHPVNPVGPVIADLVRGLGISCKSEDFPLPDQCDKPESHIGNLPETEPKCKTPCEPPNHLLVKLLDPAARLSARAISGSLGYALYSVENTIIPPGTHKPVHRRIAIAIPQGTSARIAPRFGLLVKELDAGAGVVDSDFKGSVKTLLKNNSNIPFQFNQGD